MVVKYTNHFLKKLEEIFTESDYILRYEKGQFRSGYCILKDTKVVIVNKYFPLEGRVNSLVEILRSIELDHTQLSEKSQKLYLELTQESISPSWKLVQFAWNSWSLNSISRYDDESEATLNSFRDILIYPIHYSASI